MADFPLVRFFNFAANSTTADTTDKRGTERRLVSLHRIGTVMMDAIQDGIVNLYTAVKTVKSLHADGTGNAAASVDSGGVKASASVQAGTYLKTGSAGVIGSGTVGVTAAPWCATTAADGEVYKGLACIGGGVVAVDGSLTSGANVYQITNPSAGEYNITLNSAQTIAWANVTYHKTASSPITSLRLPTVDYATSGGRIVIKVFWKAVDVSTDPSTSADTNTQFTFIAFGKV